MTTFMIIDVNWNTKAVVPFNPKTVEAFNQLFNDQTLYKEEGWRTLLRECTDGETIKPPQLRVVTRYEVSEMEERGLEERRKKRLEQELERVAKQDSEEEE